ncbi:MAG: ABC transporter permease [Campylobacterota bacterium]|nr:ABC transporter permease [Campylobacterota bacterium]
MLNSYLSINLNKFELSIKFYGEFDLHKITDYQKEIESINNNDLKIVNLDFSNLEFLDTAASIFINNLQNNFLIQNKKINLICKNQDILDTLELVKIKKDTKIDELQKENFFVKLGKNLFLNYESFKSFIVFFGHIFISLLKYISSPKNIRYREIFFEINESAIKAFWIISLTSFLIGLVIAYQSAYQLKIYGANIFIVDMLGVSILRELSPLITAIVIAGRSASSYTAQIGAMKITEELDAMKTMGFDPYAFLVLPRIIALVITMPILIFLSDMMALFGGMLIANIDLAITTELFLNRFNEVIDIKHFYIGIIKGPFFAFLIASIGIYRGLMVKNDTQSIGFNTTKSVVEAIFAVIICDAIFSIAFTSLGI